MIMETDQGHEGLLEKAAQDEDVLAVILHGSRARGEAVPESDVDICLALTPGGGRLEPEEMAAKQMDFLSFGVDARVFQSLPLHVRRRVLKEGRILFVREEDALYEVAFRTAQAFEDFKHIYQAYLEDVSRVGP